MLRELARFDPFTGLAPETLKAIARHARLVEVPAKRWLVRRGRRLQGNHYLLRGRIRTVDPDQLISAAQPLTNAVYPGPAGLMTLTGCGFLQVAEAGLQIAALQGGGLATLAESEDCWQTRFLRSHLMTSLDRALWQKVLNQLEPLRVQPGDAIIIEGQSGPADHCYLLASGAALVSSGAQTLGMLRPGDLFGEDALISGQPRNATVTATEPGVVMALASVHFQSFLTEVLGSGGFEEPKRRSFSNAPRVSLLVESATGLRERIAQLDECATYLVFSHNKALCALALFLIRKRGLKAWAVPGDSAR